MNHLKPNLLKKDLFVIGLIIFKASLKKKWGHNIYWLNLNILLKRIQF